MQAAGPYGLLARWVLAHSKGVSLSTLLVVLLAAWIGLPPSVDANLLNLLPPSDRSVQALQRLHAEENGTNLVTLSFFSEDGEVLDVFLDELQVQLEAMESIDFAFHELDPDLAFRLGMLQFSAEEIHELNTRLRGALVLGSALNPIVLRRLMDMGPLTERISNVNNPAMFQLKEGEARVLLRPTGSAHDPLFSFPFMEDLESELDAALAQHPEVELKWMGGAYRHNVEDVKGIRGDLLWTTICSGFMVLCVVVVAFRSLRSTIIVFTPLIVANVINLALVFLFMESLNTYTSFGTAILFGLGIDFAVHLVGRYREERARGVPLESAIEHAWDRVGPPCTTAALTSSAGFMALAAADFRGFSQLGTLLAVGLLVCLLAMLVLLPLLLSAVDQHPKTLLGSSLKRSISETSTYALAPVGLMMAVLATGAVSLGVYHNASFEYDISSLRRDGLAYDELSEQEQALARESYAPVVVSFDDRASLVSSHQRVEKVIQAGGMPHVAKAVSIYSVLPLDQEARLEEFRELVAQLDHPNVRYLPPNLVRKLIPLKGRALRTLTEDELPNPLLQVLGSGDSERLRLLLIPKGNMWDVREAQKLTDQVYGQFPDNDVAGEYLSISAMFRLALRDLPLVGGLALLMVTILAFIDLRKPHWVAGAVGTLVAGMVWAGSVVQIAGVSFNLINIAGIPILLGIGVDVVIHLLHRLAEEGPGGVRRALGTTGVAATISTVTTMLSFASLLLAGNRGVRSLGLTVVLGLATVFLISALFLPLAWSAGWKMTGRAPADLKGEGSSGTRGS